MSNNQKERPSFFAIIPADVRYDKRLKPNEKLLFGEITALCNTEGYCWATNAYFAELYDKTNRSISEWISHLESLGYIKVGIKKNTYRKITLIESAARGTKKTSTPPRRKLPPPLEENFQHNNTSNSTENNPPNPQGGEGEVSSSSDEKTKKGKAPRSLSEFEEKEFLMFYTVYPRKQGKADARKAWLQMMKKKNRPDISTITRAITLRLERGDWKNKEKKYIPLPASWIRGERWEDAIGSPSNEEDRAERVCYESTGDKDKIRIFFIDKKTQSGCMNSTFTRVQARKNVDKGIWEIVGTIQEYRKRAS